MISQYTGQPEYNGDMRNYEWGKFLVNQGNHVYILCSSWIHGTNIDILEENEKYRVVDDPSGIVYLYVKSSHYRDNGISRILNMLEFYFLVLKNIKVIPKPDLIIARSPNPMSCVAGIKYAKKTKIPIICDIVDLWPESIVTYKKIPRDNPLIKLLYKGEKWIYKNATSLIFSMAGGYDYIKEHNWDDVINPKKVFYVNAGVNLEVFDENKKKYQHSDKKLLDDQLFKVVYTGSVRTVNNLKLLVDAGCIIQKKGYQDIAIMIHGSGDQVEQLKEYCQSNGIKNVTLYGKIEKRQIPYVLTQSDLCVLCYQNTDLLKYGGSMNKMFEYFASGKPIIANAQMGHSIIEKYNCGVELNCNDPEKLSDEILRFYHMPLEERQIYGRNSRKAAEDYDLKELTRNVGKITDWTIERYRN